MRRRHRRRFGQNIGQRDRHVPASHRRDTPPRGRQPPRRKACSHGQDGRAKGGHFFQGHRRRHLLSRSRAGSVPADRCHRRKGAGPHIGRSHRGSEPLHRPSGDRADQDPGQGPSAAVRLGRKHPGDRFLQRPLPHFRGDLGHRNREHARQDGPGDRSGLLRRTEDREDRQGGKQAPRPSLFGQGHGHGLLRHTHRRPLSQGQGGDRSRTSASRSRRPPSPC